MKSLVILLISIAPCLSWRPRQELYNIQFNPDQELCKKLNETLSSIVFEGEDWSELKHNQEGLESNDAYELPGNFFDVEGDDSNDDDLVSKAFHFFKSGNTSDPFFKIRTKLYNNYDLIHIMPDGSTKYIFPPKYHVTELYLRKYDSGETLSFFLIQGERCKAVFDEQSKQLTNKICWKTPSFCRGSKEQCIGNDDVDSLCYDAYTGEGKREAEPNEIHYSVDIGERVYWKSQFRRPADTWHDRQDPLFYRWNCEDRGNLVKCYEDDLFNPLKNGNLFNFNQKLCKTLNETLNGDKSKKSGERVKRGSDTFETFMLPGNFFDVEGSGNGQVTKHFSFYYRLPEIYGHDESLLNISTKIPINTSINDIMSDGTIRNIFPVNYHITEFFGDGFETYYLIEGERCKAEYDQDEMQLVNRRCWSQPSFCRGPRGKCIMNDDVDSLCYNAITDEGKKEENPDEIYYSLQIGERLYWNIHPNPGNSPSWIIRWNCTEVANDNVFCEYIDDGRRPPVIVLKTLSGYNG